MWRVADSDTDTYAVRNTDANANRYADANSDTDANTHTNSAARCAQYSDGGRGFTDPDQPGVD
jgi:hypothetical protein